MSPYYEKSGGSDLNSRTPLLILIFLVLGALSQGCSSPPAQVQNPESLLASARLNIEKHRYEMAVETLEKLKPVTAETRLEGEVRFLLAEARFNSGKYPEAETEYGTYLDLFPEGPFSEDALYRRALSKVKQIRKVAVGFLSFRSYIPDDRDISTLREARILLDTYIRKYPSGKWSKEAGEMSRDLHMKEGEHELGIMNFYKRKEQPRAVLARARRVLEGDFPEQVKSKAREMAEWALRLEAGQENPVGE